MTPKQLKLSEFFAKTAVYRQKRVLEAQAHDYSPEKKKALLVDRDENLSSVSASLTSQKEVEKPPLLTKITVSETVKASVAVTGKTRVFSSLTEPVWRSMLTDEFKKDYMNKIADFLEKQEKKGVTVLPPRHHIFNAFNLTPFDKIRVVLIGQDPYHNLGQAHGLCFSVPDGVSKPPSLKNIFKELASDYPTFEIPSHGSLIRWAQQGVFLLNATLTVEMNNANSHKEIGWQQFTDAVIALVSRKSCKGVVFLLWGNFAHKKELLVDKKKHRVIKAAHPSPFSAIKFFGSKCFSKANAALEELGHKPIDWTKL